LAFMTYDCSEEAGTFPAKARRFDIPLNLQIGS